MNNLFYRIFKYGSITILLVIIASFITIKSIVEYRTNEALQDYSMLPDGIEVFDKVVLGRSYFSFMHLFSKNMDFGIDKLFRNGAIELVCTNQNYILLIMKEFKHSRVASGRTEKGYLYIDFRMENSRPIGETIIEEVTFLSKEYFDTLSSSPLSDSELNSIVKALEL